MFEQFFDALASVLNFFYLLVPEGALRDNLGFGLSIILLTILVMVLITPLTVKSTRSMLQMQRLQPEMKRIQEKYKNDREQLNAELMAFYREHQINPIGGCLPMLAQAPVFFIMYRLIEGLTRRRGGLGSGAGQTLTNMNLGKTFQPWVLTEQVFHPNHLNPSSALYEALSSSHKMNFLGMDLSVSANQALKLGMLLAIPYLALLGIMLGTGLYQNRQLRARNKTAPANPQQEMIMKFMPFFLPIISFGFPAGMALYWCTQNLCRIGTNAYITKSIYRKEHSKEIETTASEKTTGSKSGRSTAVKEVTKGKGPATRSSAKNTGRGSKADGAKDTGSKDSDAKSREPGATAKSQAAHRNAQRPDSTKPSDSGSSGAAGTSGGRSDSPESSKQKLNPRRSGETRNRPQKKN